MALDRGKFDSEVRNYDTIKRNQILFDYLQQTFNPMDGFYLREIFLLIDVITKSQFKKRSAA